MSRTRISLLGASGRMGSAVRAVVASDFSARAEITVAAGRKTDLAPILGADVVLDFSVPEGMLRVAKSALAREGALPAFLVASTGWDEHGLAVLGELARRAPVMLAPNLSLGVLALREIVARAAPILERLGYEPVMVESHHSAKRDAPSGTAKLIREAARPGRGATIQTHSIRAGGIVGEHALSFYGTSDSVTLAHSARDRGVFASGAVEAAIWLSGKRAHRSREVLSIEAFFREVYLEGKS